MPLSHRTKSDCPRLRQQTRWRAGRDIKRSAITERGSVCARRLHLPVRCVLNPSLTTAIPRKRTVKSRGAVAGMRDSRRYWRMQGAKTREGYSRGHPRLRTCAVREQLSFPAAISLSQKTLTANVARTMPEQRASLAFLSRIDSLFLEWHISGDPSPESPNSILPPSLTLFTDRG
jgi:hypothetical protein